MSRASLRLFDKIGQPSSSNKIGQPSSSKGNFPGGLENMLCSYCDTGTVTQIHIMQECPHFIDLTRGLDLTKLDENQNLEFKKEAKILCQITDRLKKTLQHSKLTHKLGQILGRTKEFSACSDLDV